MGIQLKREALIEIGVEEWGSGREFVPKLGILRGVFVFPPRNLFLRVKERKGSTFTYLMRIKSEVLMGGTRRLFSICLSTSWYLEKLGRVNWRTCKFFLKVLELAEVTSMVF